MATTDPIAQLEEKLIPQLRSRHFYESQQYVQSFVARKKKVLGQSQTSNLVFHGARLLIEHNAPADAGTLLVWFIEDGAGVDYQFKLEKAELVDDKYCDSARLLDLLADLNPDKIIPFVDKVYGPLHVFAAKENISKESPLYSRLVRLEHIFATAFELSKKWSIAFKAVLRIEDSTRIAQVLNSWSKEGYRTEKPIFFARSILQLLADKKVALASELSEKSAEYFQDNINLPAGVEDDDSMATNLSAWHLAIILSGLASLPPMPRVDKTKLFGILSQLYALQLYRIDGKLAELLDKVGTNLFNFASTTSQPEPPNPMTLLKNMLAGASAPPKNPGGIDPGFDLNAMMSMLNQMQGGAGGLPQLKR